MDDRILQFRVGVVVIAAALVTGILIFLFGENWSGTYTVYVKTASAPGVSVNTPVRKNGVLIGRVTNVELLDEGDVRLTAKIDSDKRIMRGEVARVGSNSLLGDAVLEFVPIQGGSQEWVESGETLTNVQVSRNPMEAVDILVRMEDDIKSALASIDTAGQDVSQLSQKVSVVVDENRAQLHSVMSRSERIAEKSEVALDSFQTALSSVNEIVGDEDMKRKLKKSLDELPMIFDDAKKTLEDTRRTMAGFERVAIRAEANLENLEGFTKPLGERGEELVNNIERSIKSVDELLAQLVGFSQALNSRDGTLGHLVHDRELYDRLTRAAGNVEDVSVKLEPLMNDLRTFADKLARDPRQLGVKGALDSRPSGVGLKTGFSGTSFDFK